MLVPWLHRSNIHGSHCFMTLLLLSVENSIDRVEKKKSEILKIPFRFSRFFYNKNTGWAKELKVEVPLTHQKQMVRVRPFFKIFSKVSKVSAEIFKKITSFWNFYFTIQEFFLQFFLLKNSRFWKQEKSLYCLILSLRSPEQCHGNWYHC